MSHSARAAPALAALAEADPGLAALALWCTHRDADGATRTEDDTIRYGADFARLDTARQVGLAGHHVLHVALRHPARQRALAERLGPDFDPALFALAADAIVNETLDLAGHALPRPFVQLSALLEQAGLPARSPREALADWDAERLAMALHRDGQAARAARDHGRQQGFRPDIGEGAAGAPDPDAPPRGEHDWRGQVSRALETGRQAGTGIGLLGALIADIAPPRVPWELRLRRLLARALSDVPRTSHARPARSWIAAEALARATGGPVPVFQPGRARDGLRPRIVLGLDTSSSVDDLTLRLFGAEIAAIAARTGAETHLLAFDEAVHHETRLRDGARDALAGLTLRRGGGTAFDPVLRRAAGLAPSAIVMLTDLDSPVTERPRVPVIWAVPEGSHTPPPFGTLVEIPRQGLRRGGAAPTAWMSGQEAP